MDKRNLGVLGLTAAEVGLGCMSLTGAYGPADRDESIATVRQAIDLGVTLFDTADVYGPFTGERLLGEAVAGHRDEVTIVTKFGGAQLADDGSVLGGACGRPDYVRLSVDRSLRHLGTDRIDLLLQHRVDPAVPVEETFGALGELVTAGKIRYVGISEASPATIRRANAACALSAVEMEYSLFSRDVEHSGVLGRGLLSGTVRSADLVADNLRAGFPRFATDSLRPNVALVDKLATIAAEHGLTVGQLALAWLLSAAADVVAVPGTRKATHVAENVAASGFRLDDATRHAVEAEVPSDSVAGGRTSPADVDIEQP